MYIQFSTCPTTISVEEAASERIMVVPLPPTAMPESVAPRFTTRPGISTSLHDRRIQNVIKPKPSSLI